MAHLEGEERGAVSKRVAIIGGGLAGIAAAVRLIEADCHPILIETSKRLGGRATSFVDPRTGEMLDNCQHVLMGCCTNLIDLYERIGVLEFIKWHRSVYWTSGRGEIDEMKAGWLPAPIHFTNSMRRMRLYSLGDKRQIARAMWRIIRLGSKGRFAWRDRTFGEFLRECRQSDSIIRRFWNAIIVSACNLDVDRVGAGFALQVFQEGFLANKWSYTMGLATVPLRELYEPVVQLIVKGGGEILLGESARGIAFEGTKVTGVVLADGLVEAAEVISALPFDRLDKIISDTMRKADTRLQTLDRFKHSPILGVHLFFDQPVMDLPHLTVVDHDIQWLFNKGILEDGSQHLHIVISGADEWMDRSEEDITERIVSDIHQALPSSVGLEPVRVRIIKEKRATFAPLPGVDQFRPAAAPGTVGLGGGGIRNLFLAGDWCDVGWPATMEGAVRSGYAAAEAATGEGGIVENIPVAPLARLLGLR